jgi:hypothetical protein
MRTRSEFKSKFDGTFKDYECPQCADLSPLRCAFQCLHLEKSDAHIQVARVGFGHNGRP